MQSPLKHVSSSAMPLLDTTCVPGKKGMEFIFSYHVAFRASLISQLVKNPPAMQETWVRSLGWEDPLEKGKATHSSILAWRSPWAV